MTTFLITATPTPVTGLECIDCGYVAMTIDEARDHESSFTAEDEHGGWDTTIVDPAILNMPPAVYVELMRERDRLLMVLGQYVARGVEAPMHAVLAYQNACAATEDARTEQFCWLLEA